ncbi:MAG TPA: ATP-binding cassette domain-containing protein [Kineosporiaceae bacterium]
MSRLAEASGIPTRPVCLSGRWWRQHTGPLIGYYGRAREPVALLWRHGGYDVVRAGQRRQRVTAAVAQEIHRDALTLLRPLPDRPIGGIRLLVLGAHGAGGDLLRLLIAGLAVIVPGLGIPILVGQTLGEYVPRSRLDLVAHAGIALLVSGLLSGALGVLGALTMAGLEGRIEATVQAALWGRLVRLPAEFFSRYSTGELASAVMGISQIRSTLSGSVFVIYRAFLQGVASIGLLLYYSVPLGLVTLGLMMAHTALFLAVRVKLATSLRHVVDLEFALSNQVLQMVRGLPKLRVAAAEPFVYAHWAESYAGNRRWTARVDRTHNVLRAVDGAYVPSGTLVLFALLAGPMSGALSFAHFLSFIVAFSTALTSVAQVTAASLASAPIVSIFSKVKPILNERPEARPGSTAPGSLTGAIDVSGVSFRHGRTGEMVLRDISIQVQAGEFVAIVGPTGCGKSTLLRLMIGFGRPISGTIRLDGASTSELDMVLVRRQCGVVLQNSAPFAGSIYENIAGSGRFSAGEVWAAARRTGLDEDILRMPMGMQTLLSDGGAELSGGQRQRLMMAHTLIRQRRILFLDEATSALDNESQALVLRSSREMSVTQIVVAHRLSTILHADRIVMMSHGQILQTGSPGELLGDHTGPFFQLVHRQRPPSS